MLCGVAYQLCMVCINMIALCGKRWEGVLHAVNDDNGLCIAMYAVSVRQRGTIQFTRNWRSGGN
ncbi:MAG: hypothetical protein BACD_01968 [Bacteroides rodentium]